MSKFCVFCGQKPTQKTNEHIIPRWLIELTGDPNRQATFGPYWNEKSKKIDFAIFSFDQFQFPACDECNSKYSILENKAKVVIQSLLSNAPLSSNDMHTLLSWLDKVRIGLWLGSYYLHRKVSLIEPHMFIESRTDQTDRLVFIYKSNSQGKRVNFPGVISPTFQFLPCCFTLIINNIALFNMATDFLLSRRLGLPYPSEVEWSEWPYLKFDMTKGRERVMLPLLRKSFSPKCTQIYQPMFKREEVRQSVKELYDTEYAKSIALDHSNGIGKVFTIQGSSLVEYPIKPSLSWIPIDTWQKDELEKTIVAQTMDFQFHLLDAGPGYKGLEPKRQSIVKRQHQLARDFNKAVAKAYRHK